MNIYFLKIKLKKEIYIRIGKLGNIKFPAGIYYYSGSGGKNPEKRVKRHLEKNKKLFWHIDYLTNNKFTSIEYYRIFTNTCTSECVLNKRLKRALNGKFIIKEFGSSDCNNNCPAHLIYCPEKRPIKSNAEV